MFLGALGAVGRLGGMRGKLVGHIVSVEQLEDLVLGAVVLEMRQSVLGEVARGLASELRVELQIILHH